MALGLQIAGVGVLMGGLAMGVYLLAQGQFGPALLSGPIPTFYGVVSIVGGIFGSLPWFALATIYEKVHLIAQRSDV